MQSGRLIILEPRHTGSSHVLRGSVLTFYFRGGSGVEVGPRVECKGISEVEVGVGVDSAGVGFGVGPRVEYGGISGVEVGVDVGISDGSIIEYYKINKNCYSRTVCTNTDTQGVS